MSRRALGLGLALTVTSAPAAAAPAEQEMVRPDGEAMPPTRPPPIYAVSPPDLVPPVVPERVWQAQRRKLRIQVGVAWTFTAIGLVGLTIPLVVLGTCDPTVPGSRIRDCPERVGSLIAAPIFGALTAASLVPAVIFTDRLVYQRTPERAPQLGVAPGGLLLRF